MDALAAAQWWDFSPADDTPQSISDFQILNLEACSCSLPGKVHIWEMWGECSLLFISQKSAQRMQTKASSSSQKPWGTHRRQSLGSNLLVCLDITGITALTYQHTWKLGMLRELGRTDLNILGNFVSLEACACEGLSTRRFLVSVTLYNN